MPEILHDSWSPSQAIIHISRLHAREPCRYATQMDKREALSEYRRKIGQRLARARNEAKLTQAQAAAALSRMGHVNNEGGPLPPSRIGNYEQGQRLPDPLLVKDLCEIYRVFPSAIYGFEEAPQTPDEAALTMKYRKTDDRGKRALQGVADAQPSYVIPDDELKNSA